MAKFSGANDIANPLNTSETDIKSAKSGDMILMKTRDNAAKFNHTQVITGTSSTAVNISQGNLNYRILSQNPSNPFYGGVDIQQGTYYRYTSDKKNNSYFNRTKSEYHGGDFLLKNKANIREWNFNSWNKR